MYRLILILFLFCAIASRSQSTLLVIEEELNEPIVGAKLQLFQQEKVYTYISNLDGKVNLEKNRTGKFEYIISAVGWEEKKGSLVLSPGKKEIIRIKLRSSNLFEAVLVTAQYKPTLVSNSINKATVISPELIKQSGAVNLADILTYQTGIRLSQDNVLGSSMSLGGLSGENVKILIDGVPVIGRQNGNIDISQLNLSNVERIEIIEGPLSVNYGTNALAGTINLITKKNMNKSLSVAINPYYESFGNFNLTGSIGLKVKKHQFNVSGGRNFFDGWSAADELFKFPKSRLADAARFDSWKPKEQYFVDFRYTTRIKSWELSPYARYFDEIITNRGVPLPPYLEIGIDDYYHTLRRDAGISYSKAFKKSNLKGVVAFNHFERKKNTYIKDLTTLEQELSQSLGAQDTSIFTLLNVRSNYIHSLSDRLSLETGIDLSQEWAYGRRIEDLEQAQGDYAGYVTAELEIVKNLKLKPGVRYAYNTNYESPVIPSFNIMYKMGDFRIRGALARGFRAPTLKELYFDFVDINHNIQGNPLLQSEFSLNYSGGIAWAKRITKKSMLQIEYTGYYNDVDNLITLGALADDSFTYVNVGKFQAIGNQLKLNYKSKRLMTQIASTYIGRYNRLSADIDQVNQYSFSPEVSLNTSYHLFKDLLKINAFYKFNGALQSYAIVENELRENKQDSYSILDLGMSWLLLKKQLSITTGVKNVLNVREVNVVGTTGGAHSGTGNFNAARGISIFMVVNYKFDYDFKKKK